MQLFEQGTVECMAAEVCQMTFLFSAQPLYAKPKQRFYYNDLHDLESLWRLLLWTLYHKEDSGHPLPSNLHGTRGMTASSLFSRDLDNRIIVLKVWMTHPYLPSSFKPILDMLDVMRYILCCAYKAAELPLESSQPLNQKGFPQVHKDLIKTLEDVLAKTSLDDITLAKIENPHFKPPKLLKRLRESISAADAKKDSSNSMLGVNIVNSMSLTLVYVAY
jgi:hypothetical protein